MKSVRKLLESYKSGLIDIEEVIRELPYEDLGFAKTDLGRKERKGCPEVIFGEGKTPSQAAEIFRSIAFKEKTVICTRAGKETADKILSFVPQAVYHEDAALVVLKDEDIFKSGLVAVVTAGTADINVAEEAAIILETLGSEVDRIYDVGVAGIQRLIANKERINKANCVIVVAGMEGALPSVISGLVNVPVIAVPTSMGYGANLNGITTLLAMLCSCAEGVSVVNINNGFVAAYQANMINKMAAR